MRTERRNPLSLPGDKEGGASRKREQLVPRQGHGREVVIFLKLYKGDGRWTEINLGRQE